MEGSKQAFLSSLVAPVPREYSLSALWGTGRRLQCTQLLSLLARCGRGSNKEAEILDVFFTGGLLTAPLLYLYDPYLSLNLTAHYPGSVGLGYVSPLTR
mmetsp:Transcript_42574/g.78714  ORF Transcript_42574/g.78714 Transcript_42574/m.78714 type:complete len:99 (+) Transcript_42574:242-538(+)